MIPADHISPELGGVLIGVEVSSKKVGVEGHSLTVSGETLTRYYLAHLVYSIGLSEIKKTCRCHHTCPLAGINAVEIALLSPSLTFFNLPFSFLHLSINLS